MRAENPACASASLTARGVACVYWNMLADRSRPHSMRDQLRQLKDVASALHARDKAFFYSALVVEEVL